MPSSQAELLCESRCRLGEGPLWHPAEQRLYWVDIENNDLYKSNAALIGYTKDSFPTSIGAFGFIKDDGLILATGEGFAACDGTTDTYKPLWHPFTDQPDIRMNDGKVDPAGRFWAGTLDPAGQARARMGRGGFRSGPHSWLASRGSGVAMARRRRLRAAVVRLFTVPRGTLVRSEISRCDNPSK